MIRSEYECRRRLHNRTYGLCEVCGVQGIQYAHIIGRGEQPALKWDDRNGIGLCPQCHRMFDEKSGDFREGAIEMLGLEGVIKEMKDELIKRNGREIVD